MIRLICSVPDVFDLAGTAAKQVLSGPSGLEGPGCEGPCRELNRLPILQFFGKKEQKKVNSCPMRNMRTVMISFFEDLNFPFPVS